MGLDCFWQKDGKEIDLPFDPPLKLCGGMLSGHGSSSFRGKVYAHFIDDISDVSLYETLTQEDILHVYKCLSNLTEAYLNNTEEVSKEEFEDLKRMFRDYSEIQGIQLVPWF